MNQPTSHVFPSIHPLAALEVEFVIPLVILSYYTYLKDNKSTREGKVRPWGTALTSRGLDQIIKLYERDPI